jgi:hypothetical protein
MNTLSPCRNRCGWVVNSLRISMRLRALWYQWCCRNFLWMPGVVVLCLTWPDWSAVAQEATKMGDADIHNRVITAHASDEVLRYQLRAQEDYILGQPVTIVFMLENRSSSPLWVLTWYTPLEGLKGRIFRVLCDGKEILYKGPMVKRITPTQDDYVLIGPRKSISVEVDLSLAYTLPSAKECQVTFVGKIHDVVRNEALLSNREHKQQSIDIPGNFVTFRLVQP